MSDRRETGVSLRPSRVEDQRTAWEWGNSSDIARWLNLPKDPEGVWQATSYEDFCDDYRMFYFDGSTPMDGRAFVIEKHGEDIGIIAYNTIDEEARRVEIDIWLRGEMFCGRGYGRAAIDQLTMRLAKEFGVNEVWAQPSQRNSRSVRAFQSAGFERQGDASEAIFAEYGTPDYPDSVLLVCTLAAVQ